MSSVTILDHQKSSKYAYYYKLIFNAHATSPKSVGILKSPGLKNSWNQINQFHDFFWNIFHKNYFQKIENIHKIIPWNCHGFAMGLGIWGRSQHGPVYMGPNIWVLAYGSLQMGPCIWVRASGSAHTVTRFIYLRFCSW